MSTTNVYRENARECLRIAESSGNERDRPLWIAMAQSWLRLAEQAAAKGLAVEAGQSPLEDNAG
jgi:hypothetical protein